MSMLEIAPQIVTGSGGVAASEPLAGATPDPELQRQLDYVIVVADWFIDMGESHIFRGELEEGLKYTHIAASILASQNRDLSSIKIESNLQAVARQLGKIPNLGATATARTPAKGVCLHVMNEALPLGGVTAMAARWMRNDHRERIHCLALLSQEIPVPEELAQAVKEAGGSVFTANQRESFVQRSAWLRSLAREQADFVILHVDVTDVITGAAFGVDGGPPILLVNHTAHLYWAGASVVDLLVNCRGSALEGYWAETYRGIPRYGTVPIPLLEPQAPNGVPAANAANRISVRKEFGIPEAAVVILSVGASFKYLAANGMDFVEICERILRELPEAYVLIVGTREDERWGKAAERTQGRLRALGTMPQARLAKIRDAGDIYIEGFPFGTTTSLLEAGLGGIPVVLAPAECPPPYGTDGVALDDILERPRSVDDYTNKIINLSRNAAARTEEGNKIKRAVAEHHTGPGWKRHLNEVMLALPREHRVHAITKMAATPPQIHEYWVCFKRKWAGSEAILEHAMLRAYAFGLSPRLTKTIQQSCRKYASVRSQQVVPVTLLRLLCNFLLPILPVAWREKLFRTFVSIYQGSLWRRLRQKVARFFCKTDRAQLPYAEYRQVAGEGATGKVTAPRQVQTP